MDRDEAGGVLAAYYPELAVVLAPHFDLPKDPSLPDFVAVADDHPVFRVEGAAY